MNIFDCKEDDIEILKHIKREAALYAASPNANKNFVDNLKNLIKIFNDYKEDGYKLIDVIETYNYIKENVNLTPLTLKRGEFSPNPVGEYIINIRNKYIVIKDNIYYRLNPFILDIKKAYYYNDDKQIEVPEKNISIYNKIYIYKGGVITGEYIKDHMLLDEVVEQHSYIVPEKLYIPASIIYIKDNNPIIIIENREPKFKELKQLYKVPIYMNYEMKDKHIDIRKYKKIK